MILCTAKKKKTTQYIKKEKRKQKSKIKSRDIFTQISRLQKQKPPLDKNKNRSNNYADTYEKHFYFYLKKKKILYGVSHS